MTKVVILLAALGLVSSLIGLGLLVPIDRGDPNKEWVWTTDGKRWTRSEGERKPDPPPRTTVTREIPPEERREGDEWRLRYQGKRTDKVYTREVPLLPAPAGHECSWRYHYSGKRTWRERFCIVDGVEHPYEEMHPPKAR
jgi:hypothetical protein